MRSLASILLLALKLAGLTAAQNSSTPSASHCVSQSVGQVCYGINVPATSSENADDLYIAMTGPSSIGYAGLGFGSQMKNSLYLIATPTTDNVTISVRTASGEVMPTAYTATAINTQILNGTTNDGTTWTANFICSGCRSWSTGTLDVASTAAPMIWAVGKLSSGAMSTDATASIQNHGGNRGNFALNLVDATGAAGVPTFATTTSAAAATNGSSTALAAQAVTGGSGMGGGGGPSMAYKRRLWVSHAVFMAVGWILVIGLGAIVVRFLPGYVSKPVRVHYMFQAFGVVLIIIGAVLGIVEVDGTPEGAHQVFGLVIFGLMFVQAAFGTVHHVLYKNGKRGANLLIGKVHRYSGRILIIAAMINIGLAFRIDFVPVGKGGQIAWYVVMGVLVLIYTIANLVTASRRQKPIGRKEGDHSFEESKGDKERQPTV